MHICSQRFGINFRIYTRNWKGDSKGELSNIWIILELFKSTRLLLWTLKALLHHNAKVYIAARNEDASRKAIEELKSETDKEAIFLKLDLGDLKSIKAAVAEFQRLKNWSINLSGWYANSGRQYSKESELNVLFNNAYVEMWHCRCELAPYWRHGFRGVMAPPVELVTAQGYDLQFGTNTLGTFP